MIIVNTTFVVHNSIDTQIRDWIKRSYAKSANKYSAAGTPPLFTKVLASGNDDTTSYALHIYFADLETARQWNEGVGESLRNILAKRWGENALTFYTYLEVSE